MALISVLVLIGALAFVADMLLRVREVAVIGCETLGEDYVASLSGIRAGERILFLDRQKVLDALAQDPYIKPESVDVEYPSRVVITIAERRQEAFIENDGVLIAIDGDGWVLEVLKASEPRYPLVEGLALDQFQVGERLLTRDTFQLDVLLRVLDAAEQGGIEVQCFNLLLTSDIMLQMGNGFDVELGDDTELETKFQMINASVRELQRMGKTGGIIDVADGKSVYYREK